MTINNSRNGSISINNNKTSLTTNDIITNSDNIPQQQQQQQQQHNHQQHNHHHHHTNTQLQNQNLNRSHHLENSNNNIFSQPLNQHHHHITPNNTTNNSNNNNSNNTNTNNFVLNNKNYQQSSINNILGYNNNNNSNNNNNNNSSDSNNLYQTSFNQIDNSNNNNNSNNNTFTTNNTAPIPSNPFSNPGNITNNSNISDRKSPETIYRQQNQEFVVPLDYTPTQHQRQQQNGVSSEFPKPYKSYLGSSTTNLNHNGNHHNFNSTSQPQTKIYKRSNMHDPTMKNSPSLGLLGSSPLGQMLTFGGPSNGNQTNNNILSTSSSMNINQVINSNFAQQQQQQQQQQQPPNLNNSNLSFSYESLFNNLFNDPTKSNQDFNSDFNNHHHQQQQQQQQQPQPQQQQQQQHHNQHHHHQHQSDGYGLSLTTTTTTTTSNGQHIITPSSDISSPSPPTSLSIPASSPAPISPLQSPSSSNFSSLSPMSPLVSGSPNNSTLGKKSSLKRGYEQAVQRDEWETYIPPNNSYYLFDNQKNNLGGSYDFKVKRTDKNIQYSDLDAAWILYRQNRFQVDCEVLGSLEHWSNHEASNVLYVNNQENSLTEVTGLYFTLYVLKFPNSSTIICPNDSTERVPIHHLGGPSGKKEGRLPVEPCPVSKGKGNWSRLQFGSATANNARVNPDQPNPNQQFFRVVLTLNAVIDTNFQQHQQQQQQQNSNFPFSTPTLSPSAQFYPLQSKISPPMIVRGQNPGRFLNHDKSSKKDSSSSPNNGKHSNSNGNGNNGNSNNTSFDGSQQQQQQQQNNHHQQQQHNGAPNHNQNNLLFSDSSDDYQNQQIQILYNTSSTTTTTTNMDNMDKTGSSSPSMGDNINNNVFQPSSWENSIFNQDNGNNNSTNFNLQTTTTNNLFQDPQQQIITTYPLIPQNPNINQMLDQSNLVSVPIVLPEPPPTEEPKYTNPRKSWRKNPYADDIIYTERKVGINTTTPSQALAVNGNVLITGELFKPSDKRIKTNIQKDKSDHWEKINKLKIYEYDRKKMHGYDEGSAANGDNPQSNVVKEKGFLAQEVKSVIPGAVKVAGEVKLQDGSTIPNLLVVNDRVLLLENIGATQQIGRTLEKEQHHIIEMDKEINRVKIEGKRDQHVLLTKMQDLVSFMHSEQTNHINPDESCVYCSLMGLGPAWTMFIFGFFVPIFWIVGSFFLFSPSRVKWMSGLANFIATIVGTCYIFLIVFYVPKIAAVIIIPAFLIVGIIICLFIGFFRQRNTESKKRYLRERMKLMQADGYNRLSDHVVKFRNDYNNRSKKKKSSNININGNTTVLSTSSDDDTPLYKTQPADVLYDSDDEIIIIDNHDGYGPKIRHGVDISKEFRKSSASNHKSLQELPLKDIIHNFGVKNGNQRKKHSTKKSTKSTSSNGGANISPDTSKTASASFTSSTTTTTTTTTSSSTIPTAVDKVAKAQ